MIEPQRTGLHTKATAVFYRRLVGIIVPPSSGFNLDIWGGGEVVGFKVEARQLQDVGDVLPPQCEA